MRKISLFLIFAAYSLQGCQSEIGSKPVAAGFQDAIRTACRGSPGNRDRLVRAAAPSNRNSRFFRAILESPRCLQLLGGFEDANEVQESIKEFEGVGSCGSMMGKQEYWKAVYEREMANLEELGDPGEAWFEEADSAGSILY